MIKSYLRVFGRLLVRQGGFSVINILGLALGFACFVLITTYTQYETGFDGFHENADRTYRVNRIVENSNGQTERHALTAGLLAPALIQTFPEVEASTRVQPWFDDVLLSRGDSGFPTADVVIADSSFFDVFGFKLVRGDRETVLASPMSIVLTESAAFTLFGDADPMGQSVSALLNGEFEVTGIAADPTPQSHLRFNALVSWPSTLPGGGLELDFLNRWITQAPFTYVRLAENAPRESFEQKLPAFYERNDPARAAQNTLYLQPIRETYLGSADIMYADATNRGSARSAEAFGILRFLILIIAAINFVNLSTARASTRTREVAIRSALGAHRGALTTQFLVEAVGYSLLGYVAAWALVLPATFLLGQGGSSIVGGIAAFTSVVSGEGGSLGAFGASAGSVLFVLQGLLFAAGLGLVAGIYPALVLIRRRKPGSTTARNAFVVAQFAVSMILVAGTVIALRQLHFAATSDKGFDAAQLVVLTTENTSIQQQFGAFTTEVRSQAAIVDAAGSNAVPGSPISTFQIAPDGIEPDPPFLANVVRIDDYSLLDTYQFQLAAGRYFDESRPTDARTGVVINEALKTSLGWDSAIGRRLDIVGELDGGEVIGVVKDFRFQSVHQTVAPLAFYYAPRGGTLTVRIASDAVPAALAHLEATWKKFESRYPFEYTFLDASFARFYAADRRLMGLLAGFSVVALIVACLGLYGLAAYMTNVRTKEVGVRKVLGATVSQIVFLFVSDFGRLVVLAILIATPVVVVGSTQWLEGFAYRAPVGVGVYVLSGLIVLVVALLSVGYEPVRAAMAAPVDALKHE